MVQKAQHGPTASLAPHCSDSLTEDMSLLKRIHPSPQLTEAILQLTHTQFEPHEDRSRPKTSSTARTALVHTFCLPSGGNSGHSAVK